MSRVAAARARFVAICRLAVQTKAHLPGYRPIAIIAAQKRRPLMEIKASGSVPTRRQPKESFTGVVWQDPIIEAPAPARIRAGRVSFEPGARTAWHTHPLGQTLHVISGVGRVQAKGGPIREIKAGDTVWIPPNEKHWHGAGPNTGMVHIAMQESLDGKHVTWMEQVNDEEYSQPVSG
jgi:quercetin dioxygenase-like cupin family protein